METSDINLAGRISHFFAVNRPLSFLLLVVALVVGLASFFLTPKQYNPEITRPAFAVSIEYSGATQAGAIDRVVFELVEKIDTVPGVDDIYTEVRDGARINTTVVFEVGHDPTTAKLDLLSQLEQHSYLARGNIHRPSIIEINPETIPVLQIVFAAPDVPIAELREEVIELSHELGTVEDVSVLEVSGGYSPALIVEADPNLLAVHSVSLDEFAEALTGSQTRLVTPLVRTEPYELEVVYDGRASSPAAVGALVVRDGVRVRDLANVYEGASGERSYIFYDNGEQRGEVVLLTAAKVEGSSAPVVTEAFLGELDALLDRESFTNLEYEVVANDGVTAETEIFGLTQNLLTSVAIVSLVLLLFLSTRAALVVLIAIPVTLLVVFGLGLLFDQTINRITLFALILSLGLLVDSAIVATENIYAHLHRWHEEPSGKTRERVIATAVDEIGVGLLLSTITSVIVFLPMNFITGMMGPYMGPIAFFVPAALIVSFLVAIVVTPFVALYVLHADERHNRVSAYVGRLMVGATRAYTRLLRTLLYSRRLQRLLLGSALGVFLALLILPATGLVHFQMLPRADRDQVYVYVDLPVGTDREHVAYVTEKISGVIVEHREVHSVQEFVATPPALDFNGMFKGAQNRSGSEQATLRVNLALAVERDESSTEVTTALRHAIRDRLPLVAPSVRFMEEPPGPPVRATFVAKVSAESSSTQRAAAAALSEFVLGMHGVVDVYESEDAQVGRVRYDFDYAAGDALGVSPDAAARALGMLSGSYEVAEFLGSDEGEYTPILFTVPALYRQSPASIDTIAVSNTAGEAVPLRSVLVPTHELRPSAAYFEDAASVAYVTAEVEGRPIIYVVIESMRALVRGEVNGYEVTSWNLWGMELAAPDGAAVKVSWGGEWEMTLENFRDLGISMGVALLLVYALLVAQYRRFSTPAFILVTVPLGLVGILIGFFVLDTLFGIYLTATALIGFIALIGIVVNNAIILLEYVEQARLRGLPFREALIVAGEARLRPIFLTSLTTVLASLTIASDPVWSGLAWAIVFGLSLSTILTLVVYPTLLVYFAPQRERGV